MQHVIRFTFALFLAASLAGAARAKTEVQEAEYKQSDMNFYWKGDVLKVDPNAVILAKGSYTEKDGAYYFTPKKSAPKEVYLQVINDWVEPITPPDMPASLGVAPDQMQIREPQGDVQVSLPSAPATFAPATDGMTIPNGAVVKTGANSSAAVLMGGVDSARLIPNSLASIQQTVTADSRTTEIDLTSGAVFSKVGKRIGETQDYKVHTQFGVAAARGTDFVTVAMPARTDVWIAAGTVQLDQLDGTVVGTVKSEGTGALKIIRFPLMPDPHDAMMASSETMTMAMNFIPMVNLKIKALRAKLAAGTPLTANEKDYLGRIKEVPCLIKVAYVEPPAPVVVPPPAPAAPLPPIDLNIREDGKVDFQGATLTLVELKAKLADLGKSTPEQPIIVKPATQAEHKTVKKIQELCTTAKLKQVTVDTSVADKAAADKAAADKAAADKAAADKAAAKAAADKAKADKIAAEKAAADKAAADKAAAKAVADKAKADKIAADKAAADKAAADKAAAKAAKLAAEKAAADKAAAEAKLPPLELGVHADGKVEFQGATLNQDELKTKLEDLAKNTPGQPVVVVKKEKLQKGDLRKVAELARAAKLTNVTVSKALPPPAPPAPTVPPAPVPAPAPAPPAKQLPPAMELPLNLEIRPDGKVDFQSETLALSDLKVRLEALAKATPDQAVTIKTEGKVSQKQIKKVVTLCHAAPFKNVTVEKSDERPSLMATSTPTLAPLPPASADTTNKTTHSKKNSVTPPPSSPSAPIAHGPNDTVP